MSDDMQPNGRPFMSDTEFLAWLDSPAGDEALASVERDIEQY